MSSRRAGVLGHPISHSLSPVLHRAAYGALGLDWSYEAYDVDEQSLPDFVAGLDSSWVGLSLTMPLKVAIVPLLHHIEPMAKLVRVVNTVLVQPMGDKVSLVGANTDVHGIVATLAEAGVERVPSGVVLGGGATATSAIAALGQLGCTTPTVALRDRRRAGGLVRAAAKMGVTPRLVDMSVTPDLMAMADVVISTVPAEVGEVTAASMTSVKPRAILVDVVYEPLVTPLALAWRSHGGESVGGERMLLHQAAEQVRLMTGSNAPILEMELALKERL